MGVTKKVCAFTGCFEEFFYIDDSESSLRLYQQAYALHVQKGHDGKVPPEDLSGLLGDFADGPLSKFFVREGK